MVKLMVLYGQPKNPSEFERYYAQTHMPLARQVEGVRRIELAKVSGSPDGSVPAFYRVAELYFDDAKHLQAVMATETMRNTVADLPNFASGGVTVLICDVED